MHYRYRWIKLLCCALLVLSLLPAGNRAGASGSWADKADTSWYDTNYTTYTIDTAAKLAGVAALVNSGAEDFSGKTLQIPNALSLDGSVWVPIGDPQHPFRGILIGQTGVNPELTGLTVTGSTYGGLIGYMSGATVGKFMLSGTVQAFSPEGATVGAVAGYMDQNSTILDVSSTVSVQASGAAPGIVYAGGIVGSASGMLSNVANSGSVTLNGAGQAMAGGIAGATNGGLTLKKAENSGSVGVANVSGKADAGGLVGLVSDPLSMAEEDTFMRNSGAISVQQTGGGGAGGIIGRVAAQAEAAFSAQTSNSGSVSVNAPAAAGSAAGGLAGAYEPAQGLSLQIPFVQTAAAVSNIGGSETATGAFVGFVAGDFTLARGFTNNVKLTAGGTSGIYTGGFAGKVQGTVTFQDAARNSAAIQTNAAGSGVYTGGLIGYAGARVVLASSVSAAYSNSGAITVEGTASQVYTGGIVSNVNYSSAGRNVASLGDIAVAGNEQLYTGGYVGYAAGSDAAVDGLAYGGRINVVSSAAAADSQVYTGGIAGYYGLNGTIADPVFKGEITVSVASGSGARTGGIAGSLAGGAIASPEVGGTAAAPAKIHGSGDTGGVAGTANGLIENAVIRYADIQTSGTGGSAGGAAGRAAGQLLNAVVGDSSAADTKSLTIGTGSSDSAAGGLLGADMGPLVIGTAKVDRITLTANAGGARSSLGGLAGKLSSSVSFGGTGNTLSARHVTGTSVAEGIAMGGAVGDSSVNLSAAVLMPVSDVSLEAKGSGSSLGGIVGKGSAQFSGLKAETIALAAEGADSKLGGLAGQLAGGAAITGNGTDSNVTGLTITAAASAGGAKIGGIAGGMNDSALQGVVADSPVLTAAGLNSMAGGLAGEMVESEIRGSVVKGTLPDYAILTVSGSDSQAGGLVGRAEQAALIGSSSAAGLENVLLTGTDTASGLYAGGIVGYNEDSAIEQVTGSTLKLTVKGGGSVVGGLAGYNRGVAGYADGASAKLLKKNGITALTIAASADSSTVGGLVGLNDARTDEDPQMAAELAVSSIQSSKMTGSITAQGASSLVGGLVGDNRSLIARNSLTETTPVLSGGERSTVGGLAGKNAGTLYYMYSNAAITANGASSSIGGLAGENTGKLLSSFREHDVANTSGGSANGYAAVGGLAGKNSGTVEKSYTQANVTAEGPYTYAGGLVGDNAGAILNSYAGQDVSASGTGSYSGGLTGRIAAGPVSGSYSAGQVSGEKGAYAGGFAGYYDNSRKDLIDNSYYLKDEALSLNSGVLDFGGGAYNELNDYARLSPILSSDLADRDTFPGLSGWTFNDAAWRYGSAAGAYPYPLLNLSEGNGDEASGLELTWYTSNRSALSFTIRTEEELAGLAAIVNGTAPDIEAFSFIGRKVELVASIGVKAARWTPIGSDEQHPFEGSFNGNGHTVSNFRLSGAEHAGLFGVIGGEGAVSRLTVAPQNVGGQETAGALAGLSKGKAEQVKAFLSGGAAVEDAAAVGGVIGRNTGTVTDLTLELGGDGKIRSAVNQAYVGGLIGDNAADLSGGSVTLASGAVRADGVQSSVGGLAGRQHGDLQNVSLDLQAGSVIQAAGAESAAGGIAGYAEFGEANAPNVKLSGGSIKATGANSAAGGVFGRSAAGQTIIAAAVTGDGTASSVISGTAAAGGVTGIVAGNGNASFDIEEPAVRDVFIVSPGTGAALGGIAGSLTDVAVKEAFFSGTVTATGGSAHAGGIAGHAVNSILYGPSASPQISLSGLTAASTAGGIAGKLESSRRDTPLDFGLLVPLYPGIYEAKATAGSISMTGGGQTADLYAGGLAGKLDGASLYQSGSELSLDLSGGLTAAAGGAVGEANDSRIVGVNVDGGIQARNNTHYHIGGFAGRTSGGSIDYAKAEGTSPIAIGESVSVGRTAANVHAGGFVGQSDGTDIRFASSVRPVEAHNTNPYSTVYAGGFAGLLGDTASGTASQVYAHGAVTASGAAGVYAGGFVGGSNAYRIEQAYAAGDVSVTAFDARGGGFAGMINQGTAVADAYAAQDRVSVVGSRGATRSYAGGFAGYNDGSLSRTYERADEVTAVAGGSNSYMGAFIGYNYRNGVIEDSYYEGELEPIKHDTNGSAQSANVQRVSFTPESKPESWSFGGKTPVWMYAAGGDGTVSYAPALVSLANWRFSPDLSFLVATGQGTKAFEADSAERLAALALLLDDADGSVYKLYRLSAPGRLAIESVTLTSDISLAGKEWLPVSSFAGVMDGTGHTISGLSTNLPGFDGYGLVSENRGEIRNLKLTGARVSGGSSIGSIAGVNAAEGTVSQVTVEGAVVSGTGDLVGSAVGDNQGMMSGIEVLQAAVAGQDMVGGAAGRSSGTLANVAVRQTTVAGQDMVGGAAGLSSSMLANVTVQHTKAAGQDMVGGAAGLNSGRMANVTIQQTTVAGQDMVGGAVGLNSGPLADATVQQTAVTGRDMAGGAAGLNDSSMEGIAVKETTVNARTAAGGIAGSQTGTIAESYAKAAVKAVHADGAGAAGGIVGIQEAGASVARSFSYSEVAATAKDAMAGGIAGFSSGGIADSYSTGAAEAKGQELARAGGLAGYAEAGALTANISGGQAEASVDGKLVKDKTFFGGVAGQIGEAAELADNSYDVQMLQSPIAYYQASGVKSSGEAGKAAGKRTAELTAGALPAGLSAAVWTAAAGFYPQLASFAGSLDSELSAAAVVLADGDTAYKVNGGYRMTEAASLSWTAEGTAPSLLKASMNGESRTIAIGKAPFVYAETAAAPTSDTERSFKDKTAVVLATGEPGGIIHYTTDGSEPSEASTAYTGPIELSASAAIKAITVAAGKNDSEIFAAEFTKAPVPGGGNPGGVVGGAGGGTPAKPNPTVDVLVNGKAQSIGQEKYETDPDSGRTTAFVVIQDDALSRVLKEQTDQTGSDIDIVFGKSADSYRTELSGEMIGQLAERGAVIRVTAGGAAYKLAALELQAHAATGAVVRLEIAAPAAEAAGIRELEQGEAAGRYALLAQPTVFRVIYETDGKTAELNRLNGYAERTVMLPQEAAKGAAGVMVAGDGSIRPVPTRIVFADGVWKAVMKSMTGSGTFAVVTDFKASFSDTQAHWAQSAIADLAARMMVDGTGEGKFEPERGITRAEFAAIAVKALGLPQAADAGGAIFLDVGVRDWFASYIQSAYEYRLVSGYPDGRFAAQDTISRQEAMTILARAMKLAGREYAVTEAEADELLKGFSDAGAIADYAKAGIAESVKAGLVSGRSGTVIAPAEPMTRAEVATIIRKLLQLTELI